MRIEFDTGNSAELAAVSALIASLRGESATLAVGTVVPETLPPPAPAESVAVPTPPAAVADVAVPPVPSTTVADAPPPVAGVEVDVEGLPWDARIHSTPAKKNTDGKWRAKRNLDDAVRESVVAQLRQVMAAPAPAAATAEPMFEESAPGVPLPNTTPETADAATAFAAPVATPAASVPPAPVAETPAPVPPAPPAPAAGVTDFASLMRKVTALQGAGKLTVADTQAIAVSLGLTGLRDLMTRGDLIASFDALLPSLEG